MYSIDHLVKIEEFGVKLVFVLRRLKIDTIEHEPELFRWSFKLFV
ncbi:hypothetical protein ZONE111905_18470 [Zobellia nedashkovskayae]